MSGSYARFDTEADYRAAIQEVLDIATGSVRILDRDLAPMKLESPRCAALIEALLRASRLATVHIAVHDASFVASHAPRLLAIMDLHLDRFEIRTIPDSLREIADCHCLADGKHGVRRFHWNLPRGAMFIDNPVETAPWWKRFDEIWERSAPVSLSRRTGL